MLGIGLHGWEQWMLASLGATGFVAIAVALTTTAVVVLTRQESAEAKRELAEYKLTVEAKVADAKKEGIEAGKSAGDALLRAATANEGAAKAHKRIAELSTQGDQLRKDTAEANARAAEAALSLQRLKMPRMLDPEPLKAGLAGVKPPSIIDILYVEECSDCFMLASMLHAVLNDMHWPASAAPIRRLQSGPDWLLGLPAVLQHRANPMGVSLVSRTVGEIGDGSTESAVVRAVMKAVAGTNGQWSGDETMPDDAIKIVVAPKV